MPACRQLGEARRALRPGHSQYQIGTQWFRGISYEFVLVPGCREVTNLDNFDLGQVSRGLQSRDPAESIEAVAHHAHCLVLPRCPRAAQVLEASDELGDLILRQQAKRFTKCSHRNEFHTPSVARQAFEGHKWAIISFPARLSGEAQRQTQEHNRLKYRLYAYMFGAYTPCLAVASAPLFYVPIGKQATQKYDLTWCACPAWLVVLWRRRPGLPRVVL